jgi:hypothetical protein
MADGSVQTELVRLEARAPSTNAAAMVFAREIAEDLAGIVPTHATLDGRTHLAYILTETVAAFAVGHAMQHRAEFVHRPVSLDECIAIRQMLEAASRAFKAVLSADAAP